MNMPGGKIDRTSAQPLHAQLKDIIRTAIQEGALKAGDRLPTEHELCRIYGISRTPVRQALQELVQEGWLVRIPGRGTYVADRERPRASRGYLTLRLVTEPGWSMPLQEAARLWNHDHPHRPLNLDIVEIPYPRLREHLMDAVATGTAPDISLLDSAWVAEFAHLRYILPLEAIAPRRAEQVTARLLAAAVAANSYENQLMALPASVDVAILWYRRDWLEAEGLAPPRTWEDLVRVGTHFHHPNVRSRYGPDTYGLVFVGGRRGGETTTYQLLPLLWSAGGDLIAGGRVLLDSESTHQFLTFLHDLIHRWHITPPEVTTYAWDQAAHTFAHRRAVMAFGGLYEMQFMRAERGWSEAQFRQRVGIIPIPAAKEGPYATLGGMSYVIFRQSPQPDIAFRFLEYTGHPAAVRTFWRYLQRHTAWQDLTPDPRTSAFLAATAPLLTLGRPRPSVPQYARVSEQFRWLIEETLHGHPDPGTLLHRVADRIAVLTGLPLLN